MRQLIAEGAGALGQTLESQQVLMLERLLAELQRWGRRINLTAILDPAEMVSGHLLDSLSVRPLLQGQRVIDVGTGAGFPGLPLAVAEPAIEFELIDSNRKKVTFLKHMIADLGISNVSAHQSRAEDYAPGYRFDTVLARALASTSRLIHLAGHLVAENGVMLAQKGRYPATELDEMKKIPGWEYSVSELTVPGLQGHSRHVISLRRS